MREYRIVDADCHILEPPHLWQTWLPRAFQERAPRVVKDEEGGDAWELERGGSLMHIGLVATPGMRFEEMRWRGHTYDRIRRGCFEGKARLEDMDLDGVDAEFIFPSQRTMFHFMGQPDRDYHLAGVRAYNDFMAQEFCAADPERLFFLAQMPNLGVDAMVQEMKRCREMGCRGVIITTWPSGGDDLVPEDDRFFAAAAELGMPVNIHLRIQRRRDPKPVVEGPGAIAQMACGGMLSFVPILSELIMSGLFDRVPELRIHGVEVDVGWIPSVLELLDNYYWRNRTHTGVALREIPSWYFHRHFVCTFLVDHTGVANRHAVGVRNMAWSSDYPHHGCDWPYSRKVINEMMRDVPAEERYWICAGNMVEAYGLEQAPSHLVSR
jgi:predicted TIM-barrel fold metal-dependent hydrolase